MSRILTVLAAGGAIAFASISGSSTADARCVGCGAAAVGVIGGIAAGAIIAGAASNSYYGSGYNSGYGYAPGYAYGGGGPAYYGNGPGYYGYRQWGGATSDYAHGDRDLVGTR
jgi:hypothetical protein